MFALLFHVPQPMGFMFLETGFGGEGRDGIPILKNIFTLISTMVATLMFNRRIAPEERDDFLLNLDGSNLTGTCRDGFIHPGRAGHDRDGLDGEWKTLDFTIALRHTTTKWGGLFNHCVPWARFLYSTWLNDKMVKNNYRVSTSNDYYYQEEPGVFNWASERDGCKIKGKHQGTFKTFEAALKKFRSLDLYCAVKRDEKCPSTDMACSAFIEDNISGEVASNIPLEIKKTSIEYEGERIDVGFTKKKLGAEFRDNPNGKEK